MGRCVVCGRESQLISEPLSLCLACIRGRLHDSVDQIHSVHAQGRRHFGLPEAIPRNPEGRSCPLCGNACQIGPHERGYCGLRTIREGHLHHLGGTPARGFLDAYYDTLPTNCVADWVCAGGSGAGYPQYSVAQGPERGYRNLAVFYRSCSFDCLFCQNWHFRSTSFNGPGISSEELADWVDDRTTCICYFGGDPTTQIPHALRTSVLARRRNPNRILRICWETNGSVSRPFLEQMAKLSLESGGCIKFDLKTWDPGLHLALCGTSNEQTLENFKWLAALVKRRPDPPFLIASTLLVPGYVDVDEVKSIASTIASLDRSIPYALLAFYPQHLMMDLPTTSRQHAEEALEVSQGQGLTRVRVGNVHLLHDESY